MRIKRVLVVMLLCLSVIFSVFAQDADGWYYGKPIRDISFEGLVNVKTIDLAAVTSKYIGKPFTDELYADLLTKIYALEYFEDDISPSAVPISEKRDAVAVKFKVKELPIVTDIRFAGNSQIRRMELQESVSVKDGDIYNKAKVLIDERALRDLYLGKGYTNIRVSSSVEENEEGVDVVFTINEGSSTIVRKIAFEGNQLVAEKTLKGVMELKEISLTQKGAFREAALEGDKQAIASYYQNRGYADAAVVDVRRDVVLNTDKNREELTITFVIREGEQYTYGGLTLTGNAIFSTGLLTDLVKLKPGAVHNQAKVQEGLTAIYDIYYENGYTSNNFMPRIERNDEKRQISYSLTIVERDRSHIENIIIRGNTKTKDYVILREIPITSGDIFSKNKVTTGLRNLYNTQFFSSIVPDIQQGSEENLVDLVINLEEQSTTSIEFGLTFSGITDPDAIPVSFFMKWQDSNFLGTGKTISANATVATDTQSVSLGYTDRWLFGKPITLSVAAEVSRTDEQALQKIYLPSGYQDDEYYFDYENWETSISTSLGRRWTPDFAILSLAGGLRISLLRNEYDEDLYTPVDDTISESHAMFGFGLNNSIWASFSVDDRDVNFDPSKGWFASQRLSWTGILPTYETEFFLRSDTKAEGYLTLLDTPVTKDWNLKLVLAGYSGFSFILPAEGSNLSYSNRLYIDGMFNGRGWTTMYKEDYRGELLWSNYIELRMPVVPGVLALDFFFDAAAIKRGSDGSYNGFSTAFTEGLSLDDFYFSFGPSIRFCIPQFPLRLLFTNPFQIKDGEVKWGPEGNKSGPTWGFVLSFNLTNR